MSGESIQSHPLTRGKTIDRVGGSLVNLVLGALILWVGQTTFRHAGLLASNSERFDSVGHQLKAVDERHESLRHRLEQVVSQTNERTRSRFTRENADKLGLRIREIDDQHAAFERQMLERLTSLQPLTSSLPPPQHLIRGRFGQVECELGIQLHVSGGGCFGAVD